LFTSYLVFKERLLITTCFRLPFFARTVFLPKN